MRQPGQWIDRERATAVTLGLAADPTLSHVLLGAVLTSLVQFAVGMVPWPLVAVSGALWAVSVALYAVADEARRRWEERRRREANPWLLGEVEAPRGIE